MFKLNNCFMFILIIIGQRKFSLMIDEVFLLKRFLFFKWFIVYKVLTFLDCGEERSQREGK